MRAVYLLMLPVAVYGSAYANGARFDEQGYRTDKIIHHPLSRREPISRLRLNTALGDVVALELPAGVTLREKPALGNAAIFHYQVQGQSPLEILLWPTVPTGAGRLTEADLLGERSNFQLTLGEGITILLDLQIAPPDQSVQRVVFQFPEHEAEVKEHAALRAQIRTEVEGELAKARKTIRAQARMLAIRMLAQDLMIRHHCQTLFERSMRKLLVLRAHRICTIGERTYIWFEIHNRRRNIFELSELQVHAHRASTQEPLEPVVEWASPDHHRALQLAFDDAAHGVVVLELEAKDRARAYVLTVVERGGMKRVVTLENVGF